MTDISMIEKNPELIYQQLENRNSRSFIGYFKEAMARLDQLPDWEQKRCVKNYGEWIKIYRPRYEMKRWHESNFSLKWKLCKIRMIQDRRPFKGYNPSLTGAV